MKNIEVRELFIGKSAVPQTQRKKKKILPQKPKSPLDTCHLNAKVIEAFMADKVIQYYDLGRWKDYNVYHCHQNPMLQNETEWRIKATTQFEKFDDLLKDVGCLGTNARKEVINKLIANGIPI